VRALVPVGKALKVMMRLRRLLAVAGGARARLEATTHVQHSAKRRLGLVRLRLAGVEGSP
jgi:hypothetical protein